MLLPSLTRAGLVQWQLHRTCRRYLFSFSDLASLSPFNSQQDVQKYHERKILPYSQKQLYDIVSDVSSYPHFLPFCIGSRVVRPLTPDSPGAPPGKSSMDAELTVGFMSLKESYVSKVTCIPHESVEAVASSSTPLFKTLMTLWRFQPASPQSPHPSADPVHARTREGAVELGPTLVTLDLVYAFANPLHAGVSAAFFGQVSKMMVKAFEERCLSIYGPGSR